MRRSGTSTGIKTNETEMIEQQVNSRQSKDNTSKGYDWWQGELFDWVEWCQQTEPKRWRTQEWWNWGNRVEVIKDEKEKGTKEIRTLKLQVGPSDWMMKQGRHELMGQEWREQDKWNNYRICDQEGIKRIKKNNEKK